MATFPENFQKEKCRQEVRQYAQVVMLTGGAGGRARRDPLSTQVGRAAERDGKDLDRSGSSVLCGMQYRNAWVCCFLIVVQVQSLERRMSSCRWC